jgi:sugar phosphate isomerase/epimerase
VQGTPERRHALTYRTAYQLYSSRNFPPLEAQLPELREMGYDAIEPWLPAYEADPAAFRRALDDAGLACYGFHMPLQGLRQETDRYIDIALTLGATLMIPPYVPPEERENSPDFWRRLGHDLARGADAADPHGLRVAWHNHDFEYRALPDGSRPIDLILGEAGETVLFEIDFAWILRGGADPKAELERYASRIAAIQMKDTAPPGTTEEGGWTATGDGIVDWRSLVPLFPLTPADHLVAEHDDPADWRRFARRSIAFWRDLGLVD